MKKLKASMLPDWKKNTSAVWRLVSRYNGGLIKSPLQTAPYNSVVIVQEVSGAPSTRFTRIKISLVFSVCVLQI